MLIIISYVSCISYALDYHMVMYCTAIFSFIIVLVYVMYIYLAAVSIYAYLMPFMCMSIRFDLISKEMMLKPKQ